MTTRFRQVRLRCYEKRTSVRPLLLCGLDCATARFRSQPYAMRPSGAAPDGAKEAEISASSNSKSSTAKGPSLRFYLRASQDLGMRLVRNHVLWGIAVGFALSLSTVGYKWLDPGLPPPGKPNKHFVEETGFIDLVRPCLARADTPSKCIEVHCQWPGTAPL